MEINGHQELYVKNKKNKQEHEFDPIVGNDVILTQELYNRLFKLLLSNHMILSSRTL